MDVLLHLHTPDANSIFAQLERALTLEVIA